MANAMYHAGANLSSLDIIPLHGEVSIYIEEAPDGVNGLHSKN
jgi:hypothetical protein